MSYTSAAARQQILDALAVATDEIGVALSALSEAYDLLDEQSADRLESELFRPVQSAYGRAQRTYVGFAERHGLPARTFEPAIREHPSTGVRGFIDHAAEAGATADRELAELQDSMLPVEVGDQELRAGLQEVRELLDRLGAHARELVRTLGR